MERPARRNSVFLREEHPAGVDYFFRYYECKADGNWYREVYEASTGEYLDNETEDDFCILGERGFTSSPWTPASSLEP
jgi:hypothetical protein